MNCSYSVSVYGGAGVCFFTYNYPVYNDVPVYLKYWFYYMVVCITVIFTGFLKDEFL
jgi:hypothetical protein